VRRPRAGWEEGSDRLPGDGDVDGGAEGGLRADQCGLGLAAAEAKRHADVAERQVESGASRHQPEAPARTGRGCRHPRSRALIRGDPPHRGCRTPRALRASTKGVAGELQIEVKVSLWIRFGHRSSLPLARSLSTAFVHRLLSILATGGPSSAPCPGWPGCRFRGDRSSGGADSASRGPREAPDSHEQPSTTPTTRHVERSGSGAVRCSACRDGLAMSSSREVRATSVACRK